MKDEGADKPLKTEKEVTLMEKTRLTYTAALESVLDGFELTDEVREKLEALKASLEKRNAKSGTRKPTKTQRENAELKVKLADFVTGTDGVRAKDVAEHFELSTQKASALLKQLVDEGTLVKAEGEKKVTLFKVAE